MNKEHRKRIKEVCFALETHKETVGEIINDERNAYDAMPDVNQNSVKGAKIAETLDYLTYSVEKLDEALDELNLAKE